MCYLRLGSSGRPLEHLLSQRPITEKASQCCICCVFRIGSGPVSVYGRFSVPHAAPPSGGAISRAPTSPPRLHRRAAASISLAAFIPPPDRRRRLCYTQRIAIVSPERCFTLLSTKHLLKTAPNGAPPSSVSQSLVEPQRNSMTGNSKSCVELQAPRTRT